MTNKEYFNRKMINLKTEMAERLNRDIEHLVANLKNDNLKSLSYQYVDGIVWVDLNLKNDDLIEINLSHFIDDIKDNKVNVYDNQDNELVITIAAKKTKEELEDIAVTLDLVSDSYGGLEDKIMSEKITSNKKETKQNNNIK